MERWKFLIQFTSAFLLFFPAALNAEPTEQGHRSKLLSPRILSISADKPNPPIDGHLTAREAHVYHFTAAKGDLLDVVVEQKGIDIILEIAGDKRRGKDSPNGKHGPEGLVFEAELSATYEVRLVPFQHEDNKEGDYQLRVGRLSSRHVSVIRATGLPVNGFEFSERSGIVLSANLNDVPDALLPREFLPRSGLMGIGMKLDGQFRCDVEREVCVLERIGQQPGFRPRDYAEALCPNFARERHWDGQDRFVSFLDLKRIQERRPTAKELEQFEKIDLERVAARYAKAAELNPENPWFPFYRALALNFSRTSGSAALSDVVNILESIFRSAETAIEVVGNTTMRSNAPAVSPGGVSSKEESLRFSPRTIVAMGVELEKLSMPRLSRRAFELYERNHFRNNQLFFEHHELPRGINYLGSLLEVSRLRFLNGDVEQSLNLLSRVKKITPILTRGDSTHSELLARWYRGQGRKESGAEKDAARSRTDPLLLENGFRRVGFFVTLILAFGLLVVLLLFVFLLPLLRAERGANEHHLPIGLVLVFLIEAAFLVQIPRPLPIVAAALLLLPFLPPVRRRLRSQRWSPERVIGAHLTLVLLVPAAVWLIEAYLWKTAAPEIAAHLYDPRGEDIRMKLLSAVGLTGFVLFLSTPPLLWSLIWEKAFEERSGRRGFLDVPALMSLATWIPLAVVGDHSDPIDADLMMGLFTAVAVVLLSALLRLPRSVLLRHRILIALFTPIGMAIVSSLWLTGSGTGWQGLWVFSNVGNLGMIWFGWLALVVSFAAWVAVRRSSSTGGMLLKNSALAVVIAWMGIFGSVGGAVWCGYWYPAFAAEHQWTSAWSDRRQNLLWEAHAPSSSEWLKRIREAQKLVDSDGYRPAAIGMKSRARKTLALAEGLHHQLGKDFAAARAAYRDCAEESPCQNNLALMACPGKNAACFKPLLREAGKGNRKNSLAAHYNQALVQGNKRLPDAIASRYQVRVFQMYKPGELMLAAPEEADLVLALAYSTATPARVIRGGLNRIQYPSMFEW